MDRDAERLRSFATLENVRQLPGATVLVLCGALYEIGGTRNVPQLLSEAARVHPDDFRLQFETGRALTNLSAGRALEHLLIAEGLRPHDLNVKWLIASVYFTTGDNVRSLAYHHQVAEQTESVDVLRRMGMLELTLGRWEAGLRTYEQAQAIKPLSGWHLVEYDMARVWNGSLSLDEFAATVEAWGTPDRYRSYVRQLLAWTLLGHPDRSQRDPARALAICGPLDPPPDMMFFQHYLTVNASYQLGRYEEVVEILDDVPIFDIRLAPAVSIASLGALSHSELGNDQQARTWFRIARGLFEHLTDGDVRPWERSRTYADYQEAMAKLDR